MNSSAYPRFVVQLDQMRQPQLLDVFLCHFLECYAWLYSCSIILENEYNFFYQVAPYQLIIKMFNLRNCMILDFFCLHINTCSSATQVLCWSWISNRREWRGMFYYAWTNICCTVSVWTNTSELKKQPSK